MRMLTSLMTETLKALRVRILKKDIIILHLNKSSQFNYGIPFRGGGVVSFVSEICSQVQKNHKTISMEHWGVYTSGTSPKITILGGDIVRLKFVPQKIPLRITK